MDYRFGVCPPPLEPPRRRLLGGELPLARAAGSARLHTFEVFSITRAVLVC